MSILVYAVEVGSRQKKHIPFVSFYLKRVDRATTLRLFYYGFKLEATEGIDLEYIEKMQKTFY